MASLARSLLLAPCTRIRSARQMASLAPACALHTTSLGPPDGLARSLPLALSHKNSLGPPDGLARSLAPASALHKNSLGPPDGLALSRSLLIFNSAGPSRAGRSPARSTRCCPLCPARRGRRRSPRRTVLKRAQFQPTTFLGLLVVMEWLKIYVPIVVRKRCEFTSLSISAFCY